MLGAEVDRRLRGREVDHHQRVEAMLRNQSGADKSGAWIGSYADAEAFFAAFSRAEPE